MASITNSPRFVMMTHPFRSTQKSRSVCWVCVQLRALKMKKLLGRGHTWYGARIGDSLFNVCVELLIVKFTIYCEWKILVRTFGWCVYCVRRMGFVKMVDHESAAVADNHLIIIIMTMCLHVIHLNTFVLHSRCCIRIQVVNGTIYFENDCVALDATVAINANGQRWVEMMNEWNGTTWKIKEDIESLQ